MRLKDAFYALFALSSSGLIFPFPAEANIRSYCSNRWGRDYDMVKFCMKEQNEAWREVRQASSAGGTKSYCTKRWAPDYSMIAWCIKNDR